MNVAGVDGCKGGWLAVFFIDQKYGFGLFPGFVDLIQTQPALERIFIDIPIGLSSPGFSRTIESLLRKELVKRSSTVFNVPCRKAVYEPDAAKSRMLNLQVEKKSLSEQSLNIRHKIREVDEYLQKGLERPELLESHPELCFKYLNQGRVVLTKKSRPEGISERLSIIRGMDIELYGIYKEMLQSIPASLAKKDDMLDAMCLCLANKLAIGKGLGYFQDKNRQDERDIQIRIACYKP